MNDATTRLGSTAASWLRTRSGDAVRELGRPWSRVAVRIVDDAEMTRLHDLHLDDPSTTDVLTFPSAPPEAPIDVDIAVCLDEAARHAAVRDIPVERELLLYVVHGLLHAAGHDDHDPAAFARMHAEEDRILEAIGVGSTFSRPEGPRNIAE